MESPDQEILDIAKLYCEAFSRGDYATAATQVDPQDRVDFQREVLKALSVVEQAGFDFGLKEKFQNKSVEELISLSAEQFLSLFLGEAIGTVEGLEMKITGSRLLDGRRAVVDYSVGPRSNRLEMRLAPYGWKVRLREGITSFADQVRAAASDFLDRAARDQPGDKDAELEPYRLFGYRDERGIPVIEPRFEKADAFNDGLAAVQVMGRWGFIDATGRLKIPVRYIDVKPFGDQRAWIAELDEEFEKVWNLIDTSGRQLGKLNFQGASRFSEGLAGVKSRDRWGYVDTSGRWIIEPQFAEAGPFYDGQAWVDHPEDGSYTIDCQGRRTKNAGR